MEVYLIIRNGQEQAYRGRAYDKRTIRKGVAVSSATIKTLKSDPKRLALVNEQLTIVKVTDTGITKYPAGDFMLGTHTV